MMKERSSGNYRGKTMSGAVNWFEASATFKKRTVEKVSFILLCLFDLTMSVVAVNLGFTEINPVMSFLIQIPALLILVKLAIPVLIAWLIPGRLLWPSIALLGLVAIWNIKEIVVFFFF
jgi:hypothetical protein